MGAADATTSCSSPRRFCAIIFPLISPTTFFLIVVNLVHAFLETFAIIHAVTLGGPARATEILVYKVFQGRRRGARSRPLLGAIRDFDAARDRAHRAPVPPRRTPRAVSVAATS
jgi:hypothetical protein